MLQHPEHNRQGRSRFRIVRRVAPEPMPAEEWQAAERLLARLIARAYAADHPELFRLAAGASDKATLTGPSAAARAEAATPAARGGGPKDRSIEGHGNGDAESEDRSRPVR